MNAPGKGTTILAVFAASTFLIQLSFPPGIIPLLALVCWVPCFWFGFREKGGKLPVLAWFAVASFNWLISLWSLQHYPIEAFDQPVWLSRLLLLATALWSSIPYGVAAFVAQKWCSGARFWLQPVIFPVLLAIWPVPFPGGMYLAFYQLPWIFQWAEVGGSWILSFWIFLTSFLVARGIHVAVSERAFPRIKLVQVLAVLALILIPGGLRFQFWRGQEEVALAKGEVFRSALVQPALPAPRINRDRVPFPEEYQENDVWLIPISNTAGTQHPDLQLVVWPEVPLPVGYRTDPERKEMIDSWLASLDRPLLFCSTERITGSGDGGPAFESQAVHLLTADGGHQETSKKRLIPFSEFLPFEDRMPWLRKLFPQVKRFEGGTEWKPMTLGSIELGPMVCYDDMFPGVARKWKGEGAEILVSLSNDSWFGDTRMQDIRLAAGMLCAVETRLPWLRCENAGHTLLCLPSGRLVGKGEVPLFRRGYVHAEVPLLGETRTGRISGLLVLVLLLALLGWECFQGRRITDSKEKGRKKKR